MRLPHEQGKPTTESTAIFDAFVESGDNFLDTADAYGDAEHLTRALIGADREHFVIGSKYTLERRDGDVNSAGSHRKNMVGALESSLRRLGTEYLDIYWVHARELLTLVEETMRALDDQVRAGKILYVGVSDWPAWEVARANTVAALRGWTPFRVCRSSIRLLNARSSARCREPTAWADCDRVVSLDRSSTRTTIGCRPRRMCGPGRRGGVHRCSRTVDRRSSAHSQP